MNDRHERLLAGAQIIRGNTDINDLRRLAEGRARDTYKPSSATLAVTQQILKRLKKYLPSSHIVEILRDYPQFKNMYFPLVWLWNFACDPNPETAPKPKRDIWFMKLASEYIVMGYSKRQDIHSAIVRPSAVYADINKRVLQKFCEAAINNETIYNEPIFKLLDFSFVEDTVEGIKLLKGNTDTL